MHRPASDRRSAVLAAGLAAAALLGSAGGAAAQPMAETWKARGSEPPWQLSVTAERMLLETHYGQRRHRGGAPKRTMPEAGTTRLESEADGRPLVATVRRAACRDAATGLSYPEQVTVVFGTSQFTGCGGFPATLPTGRPWIVTAVGGVPVLPKPEATLTFAPDGKVTGFASCNRFSAGYSVTGDTLTFGRAMATLMACPQPAMEQERRILDMLDKVRRYTLTLDRTLALVTADGTTLEAR